MSSSSRTSRTQQSVSDYQDAAAQTFHPNKLATTTHRCLHDTCRLTYFADNLAIILSVTIVHELTHAVTNLEILDLPNQPSAYTWENVVNKATDVASKNAENYTYLALCAGIADAGYTLPRVRDNLPKVVKEELENNCKEEYLRKYIEITKCWVNKIGMTFAA
jgi:hypothetical protein